MSTALIVKLIEVINDEVRIFNDLLETLQEEQGALVADDLEAIEAASARKQAVVMAGRELEARRTALMSELSGALNVSPQKADLACLIDALDGGEQGEELTRMREVMLELNGKIKDTNENNAFLIRQSMRYTDRCLDILTGQSEQRRMYGKFGKNKKGEGIPRSVVNRTA